MHIGLRNDLVLQMEIDHGRIKIIQKPNTNNAIARYIICLQCDYGNITTGGIGAHLARKHNELQLRYNLNPSYCPGTYRDIWPINRHLCKKLCCKYIDRNILFINWEEARSDICTRNAILQT